MTDTWIAPRIWVTSERVGQSKMNEISNNLRVLYPHTTSGDMAYRDPAGAYLTRLAVGGANTFMKGGGSIPAYGAFIASRQGSSSTNWQTAGNTNYTPINSLVEAGSKSVSISGSSGTATVTYGSTFGKRPLIFISANISNSEPMFKLGYSDDTLTDFRINLLFASAPSLSSYVVNWLVMSES